MNRYKRKLKIKAITVDDDPNSTKFFNNLCKDFFFEDLEILASFNSARLALMDLPDMSTDLIFLDVEMPGMNGFEFIASLPIDIKAKVVIISSHEHYALQAFRYDVFYYLPKPITIVDLRACINKYLKQNFEPDMLNEDFMKEDLLIINRHDKAVFVEIKDIVRLEANGSYTDIWMENGARFNSTKNIRYFETKLHSHRFYKVHRSHLVNLNKVKELVKDDGEGIIVMQDSSKIAISRSKKNDFLRTLTS